VGLKTIFAAGFTNVKFQMRSTGGGDQWQVTACSTAGVSGSGPCSVNASTLVGSDGTRNLAPMNLSATNHYLDICPTKGTYCWTNFSLSIHLVSRSPHPYALLLAVVLGLAGASFARRLATQKA
jgi:hypothetical protein